MNRNPRRCRLLLGLVALACIQMSLHLNAIEEKPLVVLITSYNNEQWVIKNLNSVFMQKYENYRVIYVDDCSRDKTYQEVVQLVEAHDQQGRFTIIHNDERRNAMANFYTAIHSCNDKEIIITLDGDDFFAHDQVLSAVNKAYSNPDIWFTYGQYKRYPSGALGDVNRSFPQEVIDKNLFRQYWYFPVSHLRTHYAWLFKLIKLQDFLYEDYFYAMTSDKAMLAPMIEMASRGHFLQIYEPLYMYNTGNPLSDGTLNVGLQTSLRDHILSQPPYEPLDARKSVEDRDEYDHASLIFICQKQPQLKQLANIVGHVWPLHQIYVLYPRSDEAKVPTFSDVAWCAYDDSQLARVINECLRTMDSRYVVLATDSDDVCADIDLDKCVRFLKKTHTALFYFGLGNTVEDQARLQRKRLPRVSLDYPIFAWSCSNKSYAWQTPVLDMVLWRKGLLVSAMATLDAGPLVGTNIHKRPMARIIGKPRVSGLADLKDSLDSWLMRNNVLGLLGSEVAVHIDIK